MARRRGNQEGSIYQRKDGRWAASIVMDGKRITRYAKTRAKANDRLQEVQRQQHQGLTPLPQRMILGDYLHDWLRDVVTLRNRPKTLDGYQSLVKRHIVPAIGAIKLAKLQPRDVQMMEAGMLARGLSANTAHHIHVVLRKALQDAIRGKLIYHNVCDAVQPPSPGRYEVKLPKPEHVQRILVEAQGGEYGSALRFIAMTGVRRGEAVALKWENVDLDRAVVSITETAQRIGRGGIQVSSTKSAAGRRGIALDADTITKLRDHRGRQLLRQVEDGDRWQDSGLVFPGVHGRILDPSVLTRNFERLARSVGCPGVRLHDLRHHHAAGLIRAGVHPRVVMERLGHCSASFSMQVYGHVSEGMQSEAAAAFAKQMASVPGTSE